MKKIIVLVLLVSLSCNAFGASYVDKQLKQIKYNQKYNTTDKQLKRKDYTKEFSEQFDIKNIKDPKLIKLTNITPIDEKKYQDKLKQDEATYKKDILPALKVRSYSYEGDAQPLDFYRIYRIAERIIRANNLEYTNWRIAIRKTPEEFNAYATGTNLIVIHTALYDSLYTNEDALAFAIAHEIAHNLLGHQQRMSEMDRIFGALKKGARTKMNTNDLGQASAKLLTNSGALAYKIKLYKEARMMEYMADTEGLNLIIKAGYSPDKALYTINFMHSLTELKQLLFRTHPMSDDRMKSAQENIYYANPQWPQEGKYNIMNSNVLQCKKSSDHVSIVINQDDSLTKPFAFETMEERLTRLAYVSYTKGDMKNAVKYFEKLTDISDDFAPYLYLSYANEYLYQQTKDSSYLKKAKVAINKAYALNKNNTDITDQIKSIENL